MRIRKNKPVQDKESEKGRQALSRSFVTGAIALVFLIIGYQVAVFIHRVAVSRIVSDRDHPDTVFMVERPMEHDYVAVRKDAVHSPAAQSIHQKYSPRQCESFRFDPNTVSLADLQRLGFSIKQAQSIINYREKGGSFARKTDFAKSFVVSDSVYQRLEPYIDIPLLDINMADSAAFDRLPGIGKYFASRMVIHRTELCGYSYIEQLMDINHFDQERFDAVKDLVMVSRANVKPFRLWTLPEDSLRLHPYIRSVSAHGVVLYRENNPRSAWTVELLEKAGVISHDNAWKLSRCVIASP